MRTFSCTTVCALHYGMSVPHFDEPVLHEIIDTQTQITHIAANPGLPDFIPALRNLPAFLSTWKRATDKLYAARVDLYMRLFDNGRKSPGWNATKQALATAKKHARSPASAVRNLDLAFTLATSI